jgi:hypothetical protein
MDGMLLVASYLWGLVLATNPRQPATSNQQHSGRQDHNAAKITLPIPAVEFVP